MGWIILTVFGIVGVLFLIIVLTDGRYFGKRLMYWIYDRTGPAIFSGLSESVLWEALAERLELSGHERILDVGTATGDLPLTLATLPGFEGEVVGVDWSPRMVEAARQTAEDRALSHRAQFHVVDIRDGLPFDDGAFDVVFCLGLLETLPHPERILAELRRVLAPDGVMVLSLYRAWASTSVALSLAWYKEHLPAVGLGTIEVAPCRGNQDVVIAQYTN